MLVTFTCPAYADITMFGDIAVQLIKMMGHSGTVPSAILAESIQPSLERLQAAIAKDKEAAEPQGSMEGEEEQDGEPNVSLAHRAFPLIEMLKAAAEAECDLMWDKS